MGESDATVKLGQKKPKTVPSVSTSSGGNVFHRFGRLIRAVAGVKLLLILAAGLFIFFESRLPIVPFLDTELFQVSSALKGTPDLKTPPVIISLSSGQSELLRQSPENFPGLISLVKKVRQASPSAIALLVDELPLLGKDMPVTAIENKLSEALEVASPEEKKHLQRVLDFSDTFSVRGKLLADTLDAAGAIIVVRHRPLPGREALYDGRHALDTPLAVTPPPVTTYLEHLPPEALPFETPTIHVPYGEPLTMHSESAVPAAVRSPQGVWPLVWRQEARTLPDAITLLYARMIGGDPVWQEGYGMMFGFSLVGTDGAGYIRPYLNPKRAGDSLIRKTFGSILSSNDLSFIKGRPVLIGSGGDSMADDMAVALLSLSSGAVSHTPYQAVWLEKCLIVVFLIFLVGVVPMLRPGTSVLVSLCVVFVLVMLQFGLHLIRNQWLLFTAPIVFLLVGQTVMVIRHSIRARIIKLVVTAERAVFDLGRFQYEQGRYDQAFETLKRCRPGATVFELLYKLGVSLERKRQFDKASSVFNHIVRNDPGYRDSKEKSERLANLLFGRTSGGMERDAGHLTLGAPGMPHPVLGRYEIESELGRGAMGIVYLGVDPKIGRKIAIKTMDFTQTFEGRFDEVKDRFFREAMAAGRLAHPNIVTIYDAGEEQDLAYIAMDYVVGNPLSAYVKTDALLPCEVVFDVVAQVADALDYAHKQSIIHRDIKPGNIIYNPETTVVKVTDFGIARIADTTTTRPGVVVGSPSFMSPEQLKGGSIDGRSDIFSLGVTFYQLLTGRLPFKGTDLSSLGYQITSVKHPSVRSLRPDLPKSAESIINRALQKDPEKRYKTAAGMARSLRAEAGTR